MKRRAENRPPPAANIDDYVARAPAAARTSLETLRKQIRDAAPGAIEVISYQAPAFRAERVFVSFWATEGHCSFCLMNPDVLESHKSALTRYNTAHHGAKLPTVLVKKLLRARLAVNRTHGARPYRATPAIAKTPRKKRP